MKIMHLCLEVNAELLKHLDTLLETGLFGSSRPEAAERLLSEAIRARAEANLVTLEFKK